MSITLDLSRTQLPLEALEALLKAARQNPYLSQHFKLLVQENAFGLRTVAAAIIDSDGSPVAGVSLTIHADRMAIARFIDEAVPVVCRIAADLTHAIALSFGAIALRR